MKGALEVKEEYLDFDFDDIIPSECIMIDLTNEETENDPHPNLVQLAKKEIMLEKMSKTHRLHFGRRLDVGGEIIDIRKPINTIICSYAHYVPASLFHQK